MVRQRAVVPRQRQAVATKAAAPHRPQTHPHPQHRRHPLVQLQETAGNRAVARLLQRASAAVEPAARDALMQTARQQLEAGLKEVPPCIGLAAQLQGELAAEADPQSNSAAGGQPSMGQALLLKLNTAGELIDGGIKLYQQAGGNLSDIEHILKARAQLSSAAFVLSQAMAGAPQLADLVARHVLAAAAEAGQASVAEAIAAAAALMAEQGSQTREQAAAEQALDAALQPLLAPFGKAVIISA